MPSCFLSLLNVAKSEYHPKGHSTRATSSANVTRMRIQLWKRCHKRRKTHKVCSLRIYSHAYINHNTYPFPLAITFWQPSTPSQRERTRRHSLSSCSPTPKRPPALHSPPLTKRPRRNAGPPIPSSASTASLPAISRYKSARSRGRGDDDPYSLNAEFEIDPAANAGVPFAFDEVVRGQRHRHRLKAGECEECHGVSSPPFPSIATPS